MALTVNTNMLAVTAQKYSAQTQDEMASAMERLASGKRINSAVDDAAGLAITARMESQISGLAQAIRNANDAISLVDTAEGALQETTAILQRIRELAIQSAGGAPSNADRVNLHKEVAQLQEELDRITNTTRFNGELLLNGTFHDTDFQIGQTNNEEITVSIGDLRPTQIGAYTQNSLANVGYIEVGDERDNISNGVAQQTLIVQVGSEIPRTVFINSGDSARAVSDKLNQSGAQINTRAITSVDIYVNGQGSFTFELNNGNNRDLVSEVTVGATAGSQARTFAAQVNANYANHNISAEALVDDDGNEFVRLLQDDGYDIEINNYVTTGTSTLDFTGDGVSEITGSFGETAAIVGGSLVIDAPDTFLLSSDDPSNTILQGTRAALEVVGVSSDPAAYQDIEFDVQVRGVTQTVRLSPPPLEIPIPAEPAVLQMDFVATAQSNGPSGQQIGAIRPTAFTLGDLGDVDGDGGTDADDIAAGLKFALNVNDGGVVDIDTLGTELTTLGYDITDTTEEVAAADFVTALQEAINNYTTGGVGYFVDANAVTVSLTSGGQIQMTVPNGGSVEFLEHDDNVTGSQNGLADFLTGQVRMDGTGSYTGVADGASSESSDTGTLVLGSTVNAEFVTAEEDFRVNPFGLSINDAAFTDPDTAIVIADGVNDTFTIAINNGAVETTVTVAPDTYFSMDELATAVETAIENSRFSQSGTYPITVAATQDENGDWGLTFGSADGYSIEFDRTDDFFGSSGINILASPTSSPEVGTDGVYEEQLFDFVGSNDDAVKFSLDVNTSGAIDLDMTGALEDLGYTAGDNDVSAADFVAALQATIDANSYFKQGGPNAVTVSLTSTGQVQIVADNGGTITFAEHSDVVGAGTGTGLAETLIGARTYDQSLGVPTGSPALGGTTETSTTGTLVLGTTVNDALGDPTQGEHVKPFGVRPITVVTASNDQIIVSIGDQQPETITIPADTYYSMTEIALAAQRVIENDLGIDLTVSAVMDTDNYYWGLSFDSTENVGIEVWGSFVADEIDNTVGTDPADDSNALLIPASGVAVGDAGYRTGVEIGEYQDGLDISSYKNQVIVTVADNETGTTTSKLIRLVEDGDLSSDYASVSFADYASYLTTAANTAFAEDGYQFSSAGSGSAYTLALEPSGPYTLSISGVSVSQAFGQELTATGQAEDNGVEFETMDDVVNEMNRVFTEAGFGLTATYSRGGDTFNFAVTEGRADSNSTLSFSGVDLANVGFTGDLEAFGGGTEPTETVRYVSQIDISTRDSALLAMSVVDAALETISSNRAGLGAVASRLQSTISNLMNISENTSAAMSRVMDADFAAESARLARAQILQETAISMLAQANATAQTVLKLLQ